MSLEVDAFPSQLITAHSHRLPAYAIGARSTGVVQEERQPQNSSICAIRSSEYKATTRSDQQTGGDCVFGSSVIDGARESDLNRGGNTINSVSPIPSLHWAHERVVTVPHRSGFLHREHTQLERWQRRSRNPSCRAYGDAKNGEGSRDFRSYESPFTQRVKEKLRRVHESGEPSQGAAESRGSIEGPELNCEPETSMLSADCYRACRERRLLLKEILESTSCVGGDEPVYTRTTVPGGTGSLGAQRRY